MLEGRYQVGDELGAGGMGTIHRGFDHLAQRPVAYKRLRVLNEARRPRLTALFQREYDTLARLHHPNIVSVYDYGFDALGPYYTMELLSGDDLSKFAPLPFREACRVVRDVASALALLHARRLLHRDVSPNNVRLTEAGTAKLLDFGALMPFGSAGEIVGTPSFIAPECLGHEPLDQRADLYALGALAYWTLTKRLAVRAYALDELPNALTVPVRPPSHYEPDIPPELDDLVLSLLKVDRIARPTSAADVIERLTRIARLRPEACEREVAFSYLEHPPLRGRDEIQGHLGRSVDAVMAGRCEALSIEGVPGAGRTAVLAQLAIQAQLRGATVLRASGSVHKGRLGVAGHLLQLGLATCPDVAQAFRDRDSVMMFGSHRSLQSEQTHSAAEAAEQNARLASSMQEVLVQLSLRTPLVLVVDDAEHADELSLALLASIREAAQDHPILIVASFPCEAGESTARAMLQARSKRLTLHALTEQDVIELVQTMFGDVPNSHRLAVWLQTESGGNPAHCMDLVRGLLQRGAIRYTIGTFTLPQDLERDTTGAAPTVSLLNRLNGLPQAAVELAQLLSLHEGSLTVEQLALASELPARDVLDSLILLNAHHVSVYASGRYAYASHGLRDAVAQSIPDACKRAFHIALARVQLDAERPSRQDKHTAGLHLIRAGAEEELAGADLIASATVEDLHGSAVTSEALAPMEAALGVYGRHSRPDQECLHLLVPLSIAGFYTDLRAQQRYLDRALSALSRVCGLTFVPRAQRWLGPRWALIVSLLFGFVRYCVRPRHLRSLNFRQCIEATIAVAGAGCAAAACSFDPVECARILRWLDPFAAVSSGPIHLSYEFCLATYETAAGKLGPASRRYARLLERLRRPVRGMKDSLREKMRHGCLHGAAQTSAEFDPKLALTSAEELERESVFFAPHVESMRMARDGYRGLREAVEAHRKRAEMLVLRAGAPWSALTILTLRSQYASLLTGDVIGFIRTSEASRSFAGLSPGTAAYCELMQAHLLRLRDLPAEALAIYERVLESETGRNLASYGVECAQYARTLCELGEHARAKALCEATLALVEATGRLTPHAETALTQQLAFAELGLKNIARAGALLEQRLASAAALGSPLTLGSLHRDRAEVALAAGDALAFEQHARAMEAHFRATENSWLIQQADALLARAMRAGLRSGYTSQELPAMGNPENLDGATVVEVPAHVHDHASPRKLG